MSHGYQNHRLLDSAETVSPGQNLREKENRSQKRELNSTMHLKKHTFNRQIFFLSSQSNRQKVQSGMTTDTNVLWIAHVTSIFESQNDFKSAMVF